VRFATRPLSTAAAALTVTVGLVIPGSSASGATSASGASAGQKFP
jgi:hypothetical protein